MFSSFSNYEKLLVEVIKGNKIIFHKDFIEKIYILLALVFTYKFKIIVIKCKILMIWMFSC